MARTIQDLEAYLLATGRPFEKRDDGTYLLVPQGDIQPLVAIRADGPVVATSVTIGPAPARDAPGQVPLLRRLLELNAGDLLYCAYGIVDDTIVLSSAHELENLDMNEVQAILSDIEIALHRHLGELIKLSALSTPAGDKLWEYLPVSLSSSRRTSTTSSTRPKTPRRCSSRSSST